MGKELVTRLSALGMTKADLARSLGVSLSSIYHWDHLPKYVEAYLGSRERECGLAVPCLRDDLGSVSEPVRLSGDDGGNKVEQNGAGGTAYAEVHKGRPAVDVKPDPAGSQNRRRG